MATTPAETVPVDDLRSSVDASSLHSSGLFGKLAEANAAQQPEQRFPNPSMPTDRLHRPPAHLRPPSETERPHSNGVDASGLSDSFVGLLSLPKGVRWPPAVPSQDASSSHFWQSDGSFSCDWAALKAGEAFCASVNATCAFCLSRALGGPSAMISALLSKLRAGAKMAVEEEISHLIQAVKTSAANAAAAYGPDCGDQQQNSAEVTQQLLKHPALQAVAFMSVHERRMAVFEVSSFAAQCLCPSAGVDFETGRTVRRVTVPHYMCQQLLPMLLLLRKVPSTLLVWTSLCVADMARPLAGSLAGLPLHMRQRRGSRCKFDSDGIRSYQRTW